MAAIKILLVGILVLTMTACSAEKPFQPNAPTYTKWFKESVPEDGVKEAMRQCGYKDLYGYGGDRGSTNEDIAKRQNCMFKNGFQRSDGYKGICSLSGAEKISACQH